MNRWIRMLADLPTELQRAIARSQRISLPRRHDTAERLCRLRTALCHVHTVHTRYAMLDPAERAALQDLRQIRGGITDAALAQRYGSVRPAAQIAADPHHPHSVSERLLLLGWLLPRPATATRPRRWLLPPELRAWLPHPLQLEPFGAAPVPEPPLALRAATTLLLACAQHPLAARADGQLRRASLRIFVRRMAPLAEDRIVALGRFVLPLLVEQGLLARRGPIWSISPAATRFLALPAAQQLSRLHAAWLASPTTDAWLTPLVPERGGLDLPVLRRRLCAWVEALPPDQLLNPADLYKRLAATLGPLADAGTHGWRYRPVDRVPWQPRRAAAVFHAAVRGPLRWLGMVGWSEAGDLATPAPFVFRIATQAAASVPAWRYGTPGQVIVPHAAADAENLRLLPFARWQAADAAVTTYQATPATLAAAVSRGESVAALWELLALRAGPAPAPWQAGLNGPDATVRIIHTTIALADPPAALDRLADERSVRRRLATRLAPGVALVAPSDTQALVRALERRGVAAQQESRAPAMPPAALSMGESATLLLACAFYRRHAPPGAPLLPHEGLEDQLRAALTPALRAALDTALDALDEERDRAVPLPGVAAADLPAPVPQADTLRCLSTAIARTRMVELSYDTGGQGDWSLRLVQPLALDQRHGEWYLRAFCTARQAERTFRVDRIGSARLIKSGRQRTKDEV